MMRVCNAPSVAGDVIGTSFPLLFGGPSGAVHVGHNSDGMCGPCVCTTLRSGVSAWQDNKTMKEELSKLQFLSDAIAANWPDVEIPLNPKVVGALKWRASLSNADAIRKLFCVGVLG